MAFMRSVGVRLRMETGQYKRDAAEAAGATEKVGKSGQKAKANLDDLALGLGVVGAGLAAVAAAAIYAGAKFDKQMSEVGAVAGATAGELDQLRQAALDAGAATAFSASEAAQAEAELAKAGIATADILGGALAGSLSLAAAGSLDLATSAEIAAAAMNTFGLKGKDVEHIADVLAAAANKSSAGVEDLGQALQQVGGIASGLDFSLEETVGLLSAMADWGYKGSDGATSLKTALMRLSAPTGEAADLMESLGVSFYDATGNMVDAVNLTGQLERAFKDLAPAQRNQALNTIFGSDAIRAANVLLGEGEAGIRQYIDAVNDQGAAARVAAAKLDNLAGDVDALKGSLETLAIESSGGASSGLRVLTQAATGTLNLIGQLPSSVTSTGAALVGVVGVTALAAAGMIKFRQAISPALESLSAMGGAGGRAATGISTFTKWGGRAIGTLTALTIATQALRAATADTADFQGFSDAMLRLGQTGEATGELTRMFGKDLEDLAGDAALASSAWGTAGRTIEGIIPGVRELYDATFTSSTQATENVQNLDESLTQLVRGGHIEEAGRAVDEILRITGMSYSDLEKVLPHYTSAILEADKATKDQKRAAADASKENVELAGAFGAAASEAEGLITAFDTLNGKTLSWREAEREAEAAADDLREALDESNGSLDVHDEKGRAAAEAVDSLARKGVEAAQAVYDQTGSIEKANDVYGKYRKELEKILRQAGMSKTEVDRLIDSIMKMPSTKTVNIKVKPSFDTSTLPDFVRSSLGMRYGGVVQHAATGSLREAGVYSAKSSPMYAFAEPQTGGEAFVPRKGNYGRSMSILSEAAGWYGANVVPQGGWYGGQAQAQRVEVIVTPDPGADRGVMAEITKSLRVDIRQQAGGNVQTHLGRS